jgi:hypothetical protein
VKKEGLIPEILATLELVSALEVNADDGQIILDFPALKKEHPENSPSKII